jgi:hypothetical protein
VEGGSRRVKPVTPIIKGGGARRGGTTVCPKPNVLDAPTRDQSGFVNNADESPGVSSFPDIPGDSSDDSSFLIVSALSCPKISKGGGPPSVEIREEGARDFPGTGTEKQHVIRIFILGAG